MSIRSARGTHIFQRLRVRFGMRLFGFLSTAPTVRKTESEEIARILFQKLRTPENRDRVSARGPFLHVLFQRVFYPRLRHSAHNLVNRLPVLEDEQGRNSHNVKPTRRPRVLIRVQLPESHLPLVLLGKRITNWADPATGSTPRGPA